MAERFQIEFSSAAERDLEAMRAFDQRRVVDAITRKLPIRPNFETKDIKRLEQEKANFAYVPPLWELKVGQWRVFYEVDVAALKVYIHAIREKPGHMTTAEVLNEADGD